MNSNKFIDDCFKIIFLLFWPIVWYDYVFIPKFDTVIILFSSFTVLSILYIALLTYNNKAFKKITILYRVITLTTFIFFLCSYLLFSKNIILLALKLIFILIYFYISCIKNIKYEMNEGVVGILSSLLLITITFSY